MAVALAEAVEGLEEMAGSTYADIFALCGVDLLSGVVLIEFGGLQPFDD